MDQNPLKQYFRRPAMYLRLPSDGNFYEPGSLDMPPNRELPIFPMTAIDEITSRTPDALYNGSAVVSIIQSCVPSIKNGWQVNSIDLDAILIAIRIATNGDDMELNTRCPKCGEEHKFGINLVQLLAGQKKANYDQPLHVRELEIHFRPLTYEEINKNDIEQFELQKFLFDLQDVEDSEKKKKEMEHALKKMNSIVNNVISSTILGIKTPQEFVTSREFISEYLNNCDKQTNKLIKEHSIALREENSIKPFDIKCTKCENQYQQPIIMNVSDFFE